MSTNPTEKTAQSDYVTMFTEDLFDAICLCNAGLTQDAPEMPSYYLNQVLNYLHGYLPVSKRADVDEYLAEKKYLPPVNLILDTTIVTP